MLIPKTAHTIKADKPTARLVPITTDKPNIKLGVLKGKLHIAKDFNAPLSDDILNGFEGS